jgi:membrane-bound metal-dependent hydrolase YbcI (DUF457 family)
VAVDIEPLLVIMFNLKYPLHGFFHSLLGGTLAGIILGVFSYKMKDILILIMKTLRFPYEVSLKKMLFSGIVGAWTHIIIDSIIYTNIRPFFPLKINPFYNLLSESGLYFVCLVSFIPAFGLYFFVVNSYSKKEK